MITRLRHICSSNLLSKKGLAINYIRTVTKDRNGVILPPPYRTSFGLLRIFLTVVPGLFIGAAISKNIANFLEENDLFVPSDDDDDDD